MSGQKVEDEQSVRDEGGNLLRGKGPICERWEQYFSKLLISIPVSTDRAVIENVTQQPVALSLRDPRGPTETADVPTAMANGKVISPDGPPAELLKLALVGEHSEILNDFHSIIVAVWTSGEVPQKWKEATIEMVYNWKGRTGCGNYRGIYGTCW